MQLKEIRQSFTIEYQYSVYFSDHVFTPENPLLEDIIKKAGQGPHKILPAIDSAVLETHPKLVQQIKKYCDTRSDSMHLLSEPLIVKGGEVCKIAPLEVQQLYDKVAENPICRHSFILAIGGGAVLDAIGFASATAHRGVNLIRIPTTVLAQNDAGIGVKNAINHGQRKNFIGTFYTPYAVINDYSFLDTLHERDKRSGLAEAVKVALIKDAEFFGYLHNQRNRLARFQELPTRHMIHRCAELHLNHIAGNGDPFERGSARPLDFGHWIAHKLEELTHATLRHGEAVAIGILLDSLYSWRLGKIDQAQTAKIVELIQDLGFQLFHYELENLDIANALEEFREHLGGELCITLLDGIGKGEEHNHIDPSLVLQCISDLKQISDGKSHDILGGPQMELPLAV